MHIQAHYERLITCHIQGHRVRQEAASGDYPSAVEAEQHELRAIGGVVCRAVGVLYRREFLLPHDLNFSRKETMRDKKIKKKQDSTWTMFI